MGSELEDMMKAFVAAAVRHCVFAAGVWLAGHEMIKATEETSFANMGSGIVLGLLAMAWSWWNKTGYQLVIGVVRKADVKNGIPSTVSPGPAIAAAAATSALLCFLVLTAHMVRPAHAQTDELANRFGTVGEPVQVPAFGGFHPTGRPLVKPNPHFGAVAKVVVDEPPPVEPSADFGAKAPIEASHRFGPLSLAPVPLTGNPIADVKAAIAAPTPPPARPALTGNPVADFYNAVNKLGKKLIVDLKTAYAYSMATNPDGTQVDPIAAPCQRALVPIIELVVNGPAPATSLGTMALTDDEKTIAAGGIVTEVEKLRILRMSLQSSALTVACGPLVQDEVKLAGSIVGGVTTLITGGALLGIP